MEENNHSNGIELFRKHITQVALEAKDKEEDFDELLKNSYVYEDNSRIKFLLNHPGKESLKLYARVLDGNDIRYKGNALFNLGNCVLFILISAINTHQIVRRLEQYEAFKIGRIVATAIASFIIGWGASGAISDTVAKSRKKIELSDPEYKSMFYSYKASPFLYEYTDEQKAALGILPKATVDKNDEILARHSLLDKYTQLKNSRYLNKDSFLRKLEGNYGEVGKNSDLLDENLLLVNEHWNRVAENDLPGFISTLKTQNDVKERSEKLFFLALHGQTDLSLANLYKLKYVIAGDTAINGALYPSKINECLPEDKLTKEGTVSECNLERDIQDNNPGGFADKARCFIGGDNDIGRWNYLIHATCAAALGACVCLAVSSNIDPYISHYICGGFLLTALIVNGRELSGACKG